MNCGHILLRDTHGTFYLGIKLPTENYRPRIEKPPLTKQENNRLKVKKWKQEHPIKSKRYLKAWRVRNRRRIQEWAQNYYTEHKEEFKQRYIKNRKHLLELKHKHYRQHRDEILALKKEQYRKKKSGRKR